MKRQIVGTLGTIFAALCCIGTPALLPVLASVGVGFLINDAILLPLLLVSLAVSIWGVARSQATHGQRGPLILAVASSVVIVATIWFSPLLVLLGVTGLMAASVWNIGVHKTCALLQRPDEPVTPL